MESAVDPVAESNSAAGPGPGAQAGAESNAGGSSSQLSLNAAAEELGVHYMTAYRYVRTGRLLATKQRGQWWVDEVELASFGARGAPGSGAKTAGSSKIPGGAVSRHRYATQLRRRAVVGDDAGAWAVITEAMASGASASQVHIDIITPALDQVGALWADGELSVAHEHQATAVVQRLLGRMTPMFRHAGRTRATVVLGAVAGDDHALPAALMGDLLHDRNFNVVNLGANSPTEAFLEVVAGADGPIAVGLIAVVEHAEEAMRITAEALLDEYPGLDVVIAGPTAERVAASVGGVKHSTSAEQALEFFETFRAARV